MKLVSWFIGKASGRGLYNRSKNHVVGENGRTLCGQSTQKEGVLYNGVFITCQRCKAIVEKMD